MLHYTNKSSSMHDTLKDLVVGAEDGLPDVTLHQESFLCCTQHCISITTVRVKVATSSVCIKFKFSKQVIIVLTWTNFVFYQTSS